MWTAQDIRSLRHRLNMDIPKFAEHLGVTIREVELWEYGMSHPSVWEETKLDDLEPSILRDKVRLT
jgi:DNA-binding transcriptional regulator YiaG